MLYCLSQFTDNFSFLNIFNYITFRTGAAIFTSFLLTLLIGPKVVTKLRSYKIQQIERQYGPASHLSKNGTPTMGGLLIFVSLIVSVLLWARLDSNYIWLLIFTTVTLGIAGVMDDYTKLVKKNPEGMKSSIKLAIQLFTAVVVVGYLALNPPNGEYSTALIIPYMSKMFIDLSVFYFAFAMLVIVGSSNATNLTDGLDGLASGCMVFTAATYGIVAYLAGNFHFADYLKIIYVPGYRGLYGVFMVQFVPCAGVYGRYEFPLFGRGNRHGSPVRKARTFAPDCRRYFCVGNRIRYAPNGIL